jgi:hypothetical protein
MTNAFERIKRHFFCMLVSFGRGNSPNLHLVLCLSLVTVQHHCPPSRISSSPFLDGTIQARLDFRGHLIQSDIDIVEGDVIKVSDDMAISLLLFLLHLLRGQSLELIHHRIIISVIEVPIFVLMPMHGLEFLMQE